MWNLDSYIQGKTSGDDVWKQRPNSHGNFLNYEGEVTIWRGVHSKYVSKHISVWMQMLAWETGMEEL